MSDYLNSERLVSVNSTLKQSIYNIAKNLGETKSEFLRKKIREKMGKYPDDFKSKKIDNKKTSITITGVSAGLKSQIEITSDNLGVKKNSFMLILLNEIVDEYPEYMRLPRKD